MGWRLFRRMTVAPGIRLNISRSGPSISIGPRGFSQTFGRTGRRTTIGLPGTGLYYTRSAPWPKPGAPAGPRLCPTCGGRVGKTANFCSSCGAGLR